MRWIGRMTGAGEATGIALTLERVERVSHNESATRYVDLGPDHLHWLTSTQVEEWKRFGVVDFPNDSWIEDRLVELTLAEIERMMAAPDWQTPAGFAFDCNSHSGQVVVSFCSMKCAEDLVGRRPRGPDDVRWTRELSSMTGDWDGLAANYQGGASDADWSELSTRVAAAINGKHSKESTPHALGRRFMDAATRAFGRIIASGQFAKAMGPECLALWVADHDESQASSLNRMRRHGIST